MAGRAKGASVSRRLLLAGSTFMTDLKALAHISRSNSEFTKNPLHWTTKATAEYICNLSRSCQLSDLALACLWAAV